jgi:hypothetical protein
MPRQAATILGYFVRHPDAADTLEGVARWRLREEAIRRGVDEIADALRWLVSEGFLREERRRSSEAVFSLNDTRADEARRLIQATGRRRRTQ